MRRLFSFIAWFPLTGAILRADLIAGITGALVLVPKAMACAQRDRKRQHPLPDRLGEVAGLVLLDIGEARDCGNVVFHVGRQLDALEKARALQCCEVAAQRLG